MKMRALWRHGNREPGVCRRHIYRWDLDKTYLRSEFGSFRELVRIPFEKAEDKIAAPGVAALIRALRDVVTRDRREVRIYFMSASPPQIGRAIKEKLELDGIVHDGIVFKDQLQHLVRGKFRHLREQVGFKLTELLKARREQPAAAQEYLFGDDYESDPLIYSLYADVTAGRVRGGELAEILRSLRVDPTLLEHARSLAEQVVHRDAVARIFINLERPTPPASFQTFGARLVPTFNYFQTAACLFEEGALDEVGVAQVATSLLEESGYSRERLANSLADVQRRGHLGAASAVLLRAHLEEARLLPPGSDSRPLGWRGWWERLQAVIWTRAQSQPTAPLLIDYHAVAAKEQGTDAV